MGAQFGKGAGLLFGQFGFVLRGFAVAVQARHFIVEEFEDALFRHRAQHRFVRSRRPVQFRLADVFIGFTQLRVRKQRSRLPLRAFDHVKGIGKQMGEFEVLRLEAHEPDPLGSVAFFALLFENEEAFVEQAFQNGINRSVVLQNDARVGDAHFAPVDERFHQ